MLKESQQANNNAQYLASHDLQILLEFAP